ncbi:MAG TPA: alpha/beta hydrolase [Candidatus Dojkabacteria bacterium]|nr:alpha/beta hydrolase [Candidatus Dojkabacteria bacterium]HRO64829.1 alpha/beta hydrolase [Candidatus Dojkabacteria bacterium]HRP36431.1 alpha/beta hydrolase [Candidatus Dojkabacteria bacterium]HRP51075.1 alpha/beta hydrolase [Candidatus Dojkabacteria bacterium]
MHLNYTAKGQGKKTIILLHGWGGSLKSLTPLQNELIKSGKFRVFNIEWPGFGDSPVTNHSANLADYVKYLEDFIINQNLIRPILVGHSFGGKVAMSMLINNSGIAEKLILINSSGLKPRNSLKKAALFLPTKLFGSVFSLPGLKKVKPLTRKIYYKIVVRESDYLKSEELSESLKCILDENLDEKVKDIEVETLLLWGEKDTRTPLWMAEYLRDEIPNSKLEVIKDARHNLPLIQPELVSTMISLFIK